MRDITNSLRRQLECLTRKSKTMLPPVDPDKDPLGYALHLAGGWTELMRLRDKIDKKEELTEQERALSPEIEVALAEHQRQHALNYEPPDRIERYLDREFARMKGQPDPFGTDGMNEAERRAWDWKDYHEQERQRIAEQAQEAGQPQYGLHDLPASQTMSRGNREHEQE
jgi:hypothetical protein